jgi:hypothetical protein
VGGAAAQPVEEEAVDGTEGQLALFGPRPQAGVVEHPRHLGRREIRIDGEAGQLAHACGVARFLEPGAHLRRASVLPHDRLVHRLAAAALPQHRGLALVGDADGGDLAGSQLGQGQGLRERVGDRAPDLLGVVLDPARPGIVLLELAVAAAAQAQLVVEDEHGGAGGALIDGDDVAHGPDLAKTRDSFMFPFSLLKG